MTLFSNDRFIIRRVERTQADREALLEVYRQCEDFLAICPVTQASLEMVDADLDLSEHEGGQFCAIIDPLNGQMMGVVDVIFSHYQGDPQAAYLELMMIAAPYRNRGLGEAVFRWVEQTLRASGCIRTFYAGVQVNNPKAVRFWQRMGFKITSQVKHMPDGTDCYDLMMPLE